MGFQWNSGDGKALCEGIVSIGATVGAVKEDIMKKTEKLRGMVDLEVGAGVDLGEALKAIDETLASADEQISNLNNFVGQLVDLSDAAFSAAAKSTTEAAANLQAVGQKMADANNAK